MPASQGQLWEGVLPGVLRDLYVGRKTGLLSFFRDEERRSVRFVGGNLVSADTNMREGRMGDVLVRLGRISEAQLKRATGFVLRDRKRLGVVLVELGILDADGLEEAVAAHVHDVLCQVFSWSEGSYQFTEEDVLKPAEGDVTLRISTGEMILQAARSVQDPDVVRFNLGDIDRVLGLSTDPLLRFQRISLTPADGYVLSRVDGTLSAREVMQLIPLPQVEVQRSLFGLLSTGVLEFLQAPPKPRPAQPAPTASRPAPTRPPLRPAAAVPHAPAAPSPPLPRQAPEPPHDAVEAEASAAAATPLAQPLAPVDTRRLEILEAHAGLEAGTHFDVLGVSRDATEAQVREAYFRLAKRFHPDVHHDPALSDLRDEVEAVFMRLGEAYEALRNPRIRASYEKVLQRRDRAPEPADPSPARDPRREAEEAEQAIRRAHESLAREKHWEAIQLLESAIPRANGAARQQGRILLARAYARNPNWVKQGEELLQAVIQQEPGHAEGHFQLGLIYKSQGLRSRALQSFRRVLELDPAHEDARAHALDLDPEGVPPASESGGLFRKLFGRK